MCSKASNFVANISFCLFMNQRAISGECVSLRLCVCVRLSISVTIFLPQTTLAGHFQNSTVGFLQPIEVAITISVAVLRFAFNDRKMFPLSLLVFPLLPFALALFLSLPLGVTPLSLSFAKRAPCTHTHMHTHVNVK